MPHLCGELLRPWRTGPGEPGSTQITNFHLHSSSHGPKARVSQVRCVTDSDTSTHCSPRSGVRLKTPFQTDSSVVKTMSQNIKTV